jgi:hypothetical protein
MSPRRRFVLPAIAAAAIALAGSPAQAQLNTQHVKGSVGVKSGSQAPPGVYAIAPLLYFYSTDDIRNSTGTQVPINANLDAALFGGGVSVVTKKQIFGGQYGFTVLATGANNRLQGAEIDQNPGSGISDSVVTPLQLGWHKPQADSLVYYTLYVPTGRYEDGASNNTGLGMWGQEVGAGTTVYLTPDRKFHAATTASLVFSSKKKDSETKPGTQMNFEGGVGGDFLKGGLVAGLAYYSSFKVTQDQLDVKFLPQPLPLSKSSVFALGPDLTLAIAKANTVYGFVNVRYFWEAYARTTTKGGAWLITATFPFHPIKLPTP